MPVLQVDNPLIENYLAQFDRFNPEEQQIVFRQLRQKRTNVNPMDDDWRPDPAALRRLIESREQLTVDVTDEKDKREVPPCSKIAEQTPEERQAAYDEFMTSWKGCLKGAPHMTAKEIRAERLEKKYGGHAVTATAE